MANYLYTTKESNFKPYSFDEMLKPFTIYKDEYEKQEKVLNDLSSEANKVKAMANEQTDPEAYAMYKKYADDLEEQANAFSKGLNAQVRQNIQNLYKRYNSEITPIENAYTIRMNLAKEQREARNKDQSLLFDIDASDMKLDDLIKNPNQQYKSYSMEDIRKNVFQEAQALSKELLTNPEIRKVMGEGQYYQIKTQNGFKNEDVTKAIQQYITGENLNANPALITLLEKNLNQFNGLNDPNKKAIAEQYIVPALYAAVGNSNFQYERNYDWQPSSEKDTPPTVQSALRERPLYSSYSSEYQKKKDTSSEQLSNYYEVDNEGNIKLKYNPEIPLIAPDSYATNSNEEAAALGIYNLFNPQEQQRYAIKNDVSMIEDLLTKYNLKDKTPKEQYDFLKQLENNFDQMYASELGDLSAHLSYEYPVSTTDYNNIKAELFSTFKAGDGDDSILKEYDFVNENNKIKIKQVEEKGITRKELSDSDIESVDVVLPTIPDDSNLVPLLKLTLQDKSGRNSKVKTVMVKLPQTDLNTYNLVINDLKTMNRFQKDIANLTKVVNNPNKTEAEKMQAYDAIQRINEQINVNKKVIETNISNLIRRTDVQNTKD